MLTQRKSFDDESEEQEPKKGDVELVEAGEAAAAALQSPEKPLDLVALAVQCAVVLRGFEPVPLGQHNGDHAQVERQLPSLVVFAGAVHDERNAARHRPQSVQQVAAFRRVVGLAGGKRKGYGRSSIRGSQMNLGVPASTRLADGLRSVFFNAPVPSGCTLIEADSSEKASMRMRTICFSCRRSKMRSRTPLFDHWFVRV